MFWSLRVHQWDLEEITNDASDIDQAKIDTITKRHMLSIRKEAIIRRTIITYEVVESIIL